jgi:hypothetical protein
MSRRTQASIIFMHVPKCAGVSFSRSLEEALHSQKTLRGFDRVMFGSFNAFQTIDADIRRDIYLNELPNEHYDFACGHFALSTLKARFQGGDFITVIREPRIRLLSQFLYWRAQPDAGLVRWGAWGDYLKSSHGRLTDFLADRRVACQTDNVFARFLLWPHPEIPEGDFIPQRRHDRLFDDALAALEAFTGVYAVEHPTLEREVGKWLGADFVLANDNVTAPRPDLQISLPAELNADTLDQLELRCGIDFRLWTYIALRRVVSKPTVEANLLLSRYINQQSARWMSATPQPEL